MTGAGDTSQGGNRRGARGYFHALIATNLAIVAVASFLLYWHDRADDGANRPTGLYPGALRSENLRSGVVTAAAQNRELRFGQLAPLNIAARDELAANEHMDQTTGFRYLLILFAALIVGGGLASAIIIRRFAAATRAHGQAVTALHESDALFKATFDQAAVGIALVTPEGRLTQVNEKLCEILGYAADELLALSFKEITHPDDLELGIQQNLKLRSGEISTLSQEKRYIRGDGATTWANLTVSVVRDESDEILYLIAVVEDINDRKKAEEELARTTERLQDAQRIALIGSWDTDLATGAERWSDQVYRNLGLEPGSCPASSRKFIDCIHPDDQKPVLVEAFRAIEENHPFDMDIRVIWPDGSEHIMRERAEPIVDADGAVIGLSGTTEDITEQKRTEQGLRENEELFRGTFDQAAVGIMLTEADGRFKRANPKMCEILGYDEDELFGMTYPDVTHPDDVKASADVHAELSAGKVLSAPLEKRYLRKDGTTIWARTTISYMHDEKGNHLGNIGLIEDIDDRKKAEQALAKTAHSLAEAQRIGQIGSWELEPESGVLIWSEENYRLFGLDSETFTITYDTFLEKIHPDDREPMIARIDRAMAGGGVEPVEYRVTRPDGDTRVLHSRGEAVLDDGGAIRLRGTVQDITESKRIEQALRDSEELFRGVFDQAAVGIVQVWPDGRFARTNRKLAEILRYPREELETLRFHDITHPDDLGADTEQHERLLAGEILFYTMEKRYVRGDATIVWGNLTVSLVRHEDGTPKYIIGIVEDIAERKEAERALVLATERLEEAQRLSHLGHWEWLPDTNDTIWSDEMYRIFGLEPGAIRSTRDNFFSMVHEDDRELIASLMADTTESGQPYETEFRIIRADGAIRHVFERGEQYVDEHTGEASVRGIMQDITERKRAEQAIRESEARLNAFFTEAPVGLGIIDAQRRYIGLNETLAMSNGRPVEDHLGKTPAELFPEEMAKMVESVMDKTLVGGEKIVNQEASATTPDGTERTWAYSQFPLPGDDKTRGALGIIAADVSELKETQSELSRLNAELEDRVEERTAELRAAQEELVKSERLATLGQLTATVSHELRNPLGAMRTSMYIVEQVADTQDARLARSIDRVNRSITRCDNIIDELLDFTRIRNLEPVNTCFDSWIATVLDEQPAQSGIEVKRRLGAAGAIVSIDINRLRRAIINVYENACQASSGANGCRPADHDHRVTIETRIRKKRLELIVSDTGAGIHPDTLPKIFEPLFSTKSFGVGLGLPTVKHIMEQHGGGVSVTSKPAKGARFVLWLPLAPVLEAVQ